MKLEIDSVFFEVGGRKILTGAYLQVNQGEVLGVLGRNGSGKTSLYKIIFGITPNDHVSRRVDGNYVASLTTQRLLQFQTEQPSIPGHLMVKEAIDLFIHKEPVAQRVMEKLEEPASQIIKALSLGKRKYLESLIFLNTKVPFLIMDEPFNGISPLLFEQLSQEITRAKKQKGIIITDHRFNDLTQLADRLLLMHSGTLLKIQGREDLVRLGYLSQ